MNEFTDEELAEKYPKLNPAMRRNVWQPGGTANPKGRNGARSWKQKLEEVFGDGEELYMAMFKLATGNVLYVEDPGPPDAEDWPPKGEKKWVRIEPNGYMMVSAFQALRDTLIGKPVSVQIDHYSHTAVDGPTRSLLEGLNADDILALKILAKKAGTVITQHKSRAMESIRRLPSGQKQDDPAPRPT